MSTPADTYWTEPRIVELRSLCEQGLSYRQIAARMGSGISYNAVISKAGRLGISNGRHAPPKSTLPHTQKRQHKKQQKAKPMLPPAPPPIPFVLAPEIPAPLAQRKTIYELENEHCRWPYGDPVAYFCGASAANLAEGVSYCPAHFRIAYRQR